MNQLKTNYNGGWPLELDDLDFNNAAIRDAFYALVSAFGIAPAESFIISGCVVTGPTCSSGYISLGGEILKFDGATVPVPSGGQSVYWGVDSTFDSAGREQLENGATVDTYEVRKAKLVAVTTDATRMPLIADRLDRWRKKAITTGDVASAAGSYTVNAGHWLFKKQGDTLFLNFECQLAGSSTTNSAFTINVPNGYTNFSGAGNFQSVGMFRVIGGGNAGVVFVAPNGIGQLLISRIDGSNFPSFGSNDGVLSGQIMFSVKDSVLV